MIVTTTPRIQRAIADAINWLRANPDRHIRGELAVDAEGRCCMPNAPEAECFCVLGRIAKELDINYYPSSDKEWRTSIPYDNEVFFNLNDKATATRELACPKQRPGNQDVLDFVLDKIQVDPKLLTGEKPTIWRRIKALFRAR